MNVPKKKTIGLFFIFIASICTYFFTVFYIPIPSTSTKVVILKLPKVGIGNQLFHYAAAYSLAKQLDAQLWIMPKKTKGNKPFSVTDRNFMLHKFNINYDRLITPSQYKYITLLHNRVMVTESNFNSINKNKAQFFNIANNGSDYFESERFFKNYSKELKHILPPIPAYNPELVNKIEQSESVAVHVRHGDFKQDNRIIPISYQIQAMQKMKYLLKNPHFFIFSDDYSFVKNAFSGITNATVVSGNYKSDSLYDLQLMAHCKHMITANSTFSWWGAYFIKNPNKIIIAPNFYAESLNSKRTDFYPTQWILLNPFIIHPEKIKSS